MAEYSKRPGGRSARVRHLVLAAAATLSVESGEAGVTIPAIAAESGIHQASIYRRWGTAAGVLLDLAIEQLNDGRPPRDTGSLHADLVAYASAAAESIRGPGGLAFLRAALDPETRDTPAAEAASRQMLEGRAAEIQEMLDRATKRGEPVIAVTDVIDGVLAPLYLREIFHIGGVDTEFLRGLVDRLIPAGSRGSAAS